MEAQTLVRQLGAWPAGRGPLQQKLARAVMQAIRFGAVHPGVRLPSERALAQALNVSRTTVVAAYDTLRESGWLESRSGSGTWVCARSPVIAAARGAAQGAALAASPLLAMLACDHADVIDFALGSPEPLTAVPPERFTLPAEEHLALLHDRLYHPLGLPVLREAIARYFTAAGLKTTAEQILVTNGAQQAISLCAGLYVQRGDSVLVEDPVYFGALDVFRSLGARLCPMAVESEGVAPAAVRDRITATAGRLVYVTPTFQNPTGAVMPAAARRELSRIAADLGVPVLEDHTLGEMVLAGSPPPLIATFAADAPVLTVGSLSKLIWQGLRVGWVRAQEPVIDRLARLKSATDLGSPLHTQAIAARLMAEIPEARKLRRAEMRPRRDLLIRLLGQYLPSWTFRVPSGGLFLWAKMPAGDARELAQVALRHGVVILPGPTMSATERYSQFIRLPFLASEVTLRSGVKRLAAAWREYQSAARRERQSVAMV